MKFSDNYYFLIYFDLKKNSIAICALTSMLVGGFKLPGEKILAIFLLYMKMWLDFTLQGV